MDLIKVGELPGTSFYRLEGEWPEASPGKQHFHVRARGVHACVTGIEGSTEADAEGNALGLFLYRCFDDTYRGDVFGNERWTYCATPDCDGCDLEVHVVRMQDGRVAAKPRVLVFDL